MTHAISLTPSLVARFWAKVNKNGPAPQDRPDLGPCWLWTASVVRGYGSIGSGGRRGKTLAAHRVSYEIHKGELPTGHAHHLDHLCRVPRCVNPDHLELVTAGENVRRGVMGQRVRERYEAMTHCINGHEFTPENTYHRPGTKLRCCRECNRQRTRDYALRKQAKPTE